MPTLLPSPLNSGGEGLVKRGRLRSRYGIARQSGHVLPSRSGEVIERELWSEKIRSSGWRAENDGHETDRPIVNSHEIPSRLTACDRLSLKVHGSKLDGDSPTDNANLKKADGNA